jgi:hypothetical protein
VAAKPSLTVGLLTPENLKFYYLSHIIGSPQRLIFRTRTETRGNRPNIRNGHRGA